MVASQRRTLLLVSGACIAALSQRAQASTVTVSSQSAGQTPSIVGYGTSDYYPGSNTQSWWKYSGANGARIWSSPSDVEPTDDNSPWGDNVTTQAGFISRRMSLRANPLSSTYVDWTYFNNQFANQTTSGNNTMKLQYAAQSLTSINNKLLVVMQRRVGSWDWPSTPTSNSSTDWKNRWESWQHWYVQAFYYAKNFGTERFQMYNEPDHSSASPLTQSQWIEQMQYASNAVESAIADVNALYGKNLTVRMHGGVTAGGSDLDPGEWGDVAVANLHRPLFSSSDVPGYDLFKTFDYHQYTSTPSTFGDTLAATAGTLNTRTGNAANHPIAISEFNVYTNADWPSTLTAESPDIHKNLAGMLIKAANADTLGAAKELYLFKFGLTGNQNATHYTDDTHSPYNIGGVTKSGQVYRLFAKGFAAKELSVAPTSTNTALRMAASNSTAEQMRYLFAGNSSSSSNQTMTMDLTSWNITPGTQVVVEQVSDRYHGDVSQVITVPVNRQITVNMDPTATVLVSVPTGPVTQAAFSATDDALVAAGSNAAVNFGTSAAINVQNNASASNSRSAAFVKFDLGSVNPAAIKTAVLKLTGSNPDVAASTVIGHLYGLSTDSWGEATITWNNAPNLGGGLGNDGSGTVNEIRDNFVEDINNTADIIGNITAGATEGSMMVDVTAFLKAQTDQFASFMLTREVRFDGDVDPLTTLIQIRSKEYQGGAFAPQLLLQIAPTAAQWSVNNSGSWSNSANWSGGSPNGVDAAATFGNIITSPRTITVDAPQTVGSISFAGASKYTLAGNSTITLNTSVGRAQVTVLSGNHEITAPLKPAADTSFTVIAGSTLIIGNLAASNVNLSKDGSGTVSVQNIRAIALNVNAGTLLIPASGGSDSAASRLASLAVAPGAKLDLADNLMVIDYAGASPTGDVRGLLQSGNLISSTALASNDPMYAIGYIENTTGMPTFGGQPADMTSVLVAYVLGGDTNFDGRVNTIDFNPLAGNFGAGNTFWTDGDLNYDGLISSADFNLLSANYGAMTVPPSAPSLGVIVPEPALFSISCLAVLLRRPTRHIRPCEHHS